MSDSLFKQVADKQSAKKIVHGMQGEPNEKGFNAGNFLYQRIKPDETDKSDNEDQNRAGAVN